MIKRLGFAAIVAAGTLALASCGEGSAEAQLTKGEPDGAIVIASNGFMATCSPYDGIKNCFAHSGRIVDEGTDAQGNMTVQEWFSRIENMHGVAAGTYLSLSVDPSYADETMPKGYFLIVTDDVA